MITGSRDIEIKVDVIAPTPQPPPSTALPLLSPSPPSPDPPVPFAQMIFDLSLFLVFFFVILLGFTCTLLGLADAAHLPTAHATVSTGELWSSPVDSVDDDLPLTAMPFYAIFTEIDLQKLGKVAPLAEPQPSALPSHGGRAAAAARSNWRAGRALRSMPPASHSRATTKPQPG